MINSEYLDKPATKPASSMSRVQTWLNLIVVMCMQNPRIISYSIVLPSMYQFITAPTNGTNCEAGGNISQCEGSLHSGLGQPEIYSWAVTLFSLGSLIVSPIMGILPRFITYRFSILLVLLTFLLGSLLYAMTTKPWMILVARFLLGVFDGASPILVLSYASETACRIEKEKQKVKGSSAEMHSERSARGGRSFSLKDKLFTADLVHKSVIYPVSLGISTIMAQFKQIDQYRWPGWFLLALGTLYTLVFLLVYREATPCKKSPEVERDSKSLDDEIGTKKKRIRHYSSICLKRFTCETLTIISYFVYCGYVSSSLFNIPDTFLPPVLSDHFGFRISDNSLFFLGLVIVSLGAGVILTILKCMRTDNRIVLVITLCIGITGLILASDWQSMGQDPCSSSFLTLNKNSTIQTDFDGPSCKSAFGNSSGSLANICFASSSDTHHCSSSCLSRVTGQKCIYCQPYCRSEEKSISFVQFSIGIIVSVICLQLFVTVTVSITTDVTPHALQGTAISAVFTANSIARIVTPLWIVYVYEVFGQRIFPPLLVIIATLLLALFGAIGLYRQLGHRENKKGSVKGVSNPMVKELEKYSGSLINLSKTI